MVGDEGPGGGAALDGVQYRGIHLQIAQVVKIGPDGGDRPGALDKGLPHLGIDDQVHIALAVAGVHILQAVELFRQGQKALAQQDILPHVDGNFPPAGAEHKALDADDVADVQLLEPLISLGTQLVDLGVDLDLALLVLDVAEGRLAHVPLGHDAAGDGHILVFQLFKIVQDLPAVGGAVKAHLLKGILSGGPEGCQLVPADLQDLTQLLLGGLLRRVSMLIHMHSSSFIL